ncbi:glycerate kinase [Jeotgalibacillus soli]|uniref:Glycerate kinase n=1 Tax=Jeotgalibacillus soli TaxID=889306 RepID=A0A0C2VLA2_9BACL|nr:glycerate kinase [Jeotgalibacillus soli]KIL45241.1 glycerate kinase [Jeotgalibacillus soli]
MKFVIAPDSYKGSLSAIEVANTMKKAISNEIPLADVIINPMADGGEGTLEALVTATNGRLETIYVAGPLGDKIQSAYGILSDEKTAVIEMANISGLPMISFEDRNPMLTTTYGVGEAILHALEQGFRKFIIGIGGSATNDGGLGMLQALGAVFADKNGFPVSPAASGLQNIETISFDTIDSRLRSCEIFVACDVENPLCGPNGASHVFGPQKGATKDQVIELDDLLRRYADQIEMVLGKKYQEIPGAGAAGGLGFALLTIGAIMESGAKIVSDATGLEQKLAEADWVLTGEGQSDHQTLFGKVPSYVAKLAKGNSVKTILISGSLGNGYKELDALFASCHSTIPRPISLADALADAEENLYESTRNIVKLLKNQ